MEIRKLWSDLKSSLWFRPILWLITLVTMAFVLMILDRQIGTEGLPFATDSLSWFFVSSADGARAMLSAIATAVLTVTTLAFSIMMVAVVQTANSYSPRLLPQYLSDTSNQHVLGILIGTFMYCLLVLRTIQTTDTGNSFIPALATNFGLLLALLSTGAFIYFINHSAHSISVGNIVLLTLRRTESLVDQNDIFPENVGRACHESRSLSPPSGPAMYLTAAKGGYVQFLNSDSLMSQAIEADVTIRLEHMVGDYVLPGMRLASVWPADALDDRQQEHILATIHLSKERSLVQDLLYGIAQLADVAVRALSPGVNDPTTAVQCIDALALVLSKFAAHEPVSSYRCDEDGNVRLIVDAPDFKRVLDTAFRQIRRYGASDLQTSLRLLEVYHNLGTQIVRVEQRRTLWHHTLQLMETVGAQMEVESDRRTVDDAFVKTANALDQNPEPHLLTAREKSKVRL